MGIVKNGCGQSGHRTLKSSVSQEWPDGGNRFFLNVGSNSGELKVALIILVHEIVKSAIL